MANELKISRFYDFGPYRLDTDQKVLARDGNPVPLTPKAFEVLWTLVSRSGQIVEKDDLMKTVWPDTFVEESNLAFQVSTLRKTLGDGFIDTIPKRGYRFAARVEEAAGTPTPQPAPAEDTHASVAATSRTSRLKPMLILAAAGVLAITAVVAFDFGGWLPLSRPVRSIAILPLKSPAGMEEVGLGLADAMITRLGNSDQLRVRPTSAVYRFQGRELDPIEVGKQLGVDAVAEGMVQRSGNRIRATLQLIRVSDGKHLMAGQFDHDSTDLFALEDSLSARLSQALAARLTGAQREGLARRPSTNAEAHRLVLVGRYHHFRQKNLPAIDAYKQAIQKDERYAPAWAGLSKAYFGATYENRMPVREGMPKARDAAARAVGLDPNLPQAHAALAFVQMWFDYDLPAARQSWQRALALDPDDRDALDAKSLDALFTGRFQESIDARKRNLEANPVEPFAHWLVAVSLYYAGSYDEALTYAKKAMELDPHFVPAHAALAMIYRLQGRHDDHIAASLEERRLNGADAATLESMRQTYKRGGLKAWDQARLDAALERGRKGNPVSPLGLANLYRDVGDYEKAIDWLEKAYEERIPNVMVSKTYPPWKPLQSHPRFQKLLAKLGLVGQVSDLPRH